MGIKFYTDNDFNYNIVRGLRLRGIDIITSREDGTNQFSDLELLEHVTKLERVLLTHDKDFFRISASFLETNTYFSGIIFINQTSSIGRSIEDLELIAKVGKKNEYENTLSYLPF